MNRAAAVLAATLAAACVRTPPAPSVGSDVGKRLVAPSGMVASGNAYASEAGTEMLRRGGNAVDAAVAATFVLGVVEPMMSGLGGGGGMLIYSARAGRAEYVDFYSTAGSSADTALRSNRSLSPERGVAIPGTVGGVLSAHERFGKLSREAVLEPAIRLAAGGFIAGSLLAREVAADSAKLARSEGPRRIFLPNGNPIRAGDRVVQPELATTLRRIAAEGAAGFYRGPVAEEIVRVLAAGGSPLTTADLAAFAPRWKRPVCTTYRGRVVLSAPAPQSGVQVLQTLNLLEGRDLPALGLPSRSPEAFRVLSGAMRVSVSDREAFIGDPAKAAVPMAGLTAKRYAASRATLVDDTVAAPRLTTGSPWSADQEGASTDCARFEPVGPAQAPRAAEASTDDADGFAETTHLSTVDAEGNAVALTNTLGLGFGTGAWAAGAFLNSAMLNFARSDSSANALGPWRVPASTIAPTIVLDGKQVKMVVGSPGSQAIPPAIVETIIYTLDYALDPLDALRMPRVIPAATRRLQIEAGFSGEVLDLARRMGYDVVTSPPTSASFGGVHVIVRSGKHWVGAADPRRDGEVRGY